MKKFFIDEYCARCNYMSDELVEYSFDDGSDIVHICLDCNSALVDNNG